MYFSLIRTLIIFCAASGVSSSSISAPCNLKDVPCLEKLANDVMPIIFAASPENGIEGTDPVFVREVQDNLSTLRLKLSNNTMSGISNCVVTNMKINEDITLFQCDLKCPKIIIYGYYDMTGELLGRPAEGNGNYTFITEKYFVHVDAGLMTEKNNGKTNLVVNSFKLNLHPEEVTKFDISNLFNGQKDLADAFIKFCNENWKEITDILQEPFWYACFEIIFSNINKHLKTIALEDFVSI